MEIIAVLLALIFLCAYIVFSSIEFGVSVFNMWPKFVGGNKEVLKNYLSPVWETTNVFLVCFAVCIFVFFPGAVKYFGTDLLPLIFTALVFAGLRIVSILLIYYGELEHKIIDGVFLLSSFVMPGILSGFYVYALTGRVIILPYTFLSVGFWFLVCSVILLISSSFFRYFLKQGNEQLNNLITTSANAVLLGLIILALGIFTDAPRIFRSSGLILAAATLLIVAFGNLFYCIKRQKLLASFLSAIVLVIILVLSVALMQLPYLGYPNITIYEAFTGTATFRIMLFCLPVGLLIVTPPIIWMYKTFAFKK